MADFCWFKPNPNDPQSLRVAPKQKEYNPGGGSVTLQNDTTETICVDFPAELGVPVADNPLWLNPGAGRSVSIFPQYPDSYPCPTSIVPRECPTCGAKLEERTEVRFRPEGRLKIAGAVSGEPCGRRVAQALYYGESDGRDDADPIIKIKP